MGKSLRRIRERSFGLSLTISAVLVLGALGASAPANAVDSASEASPAAVEGAVAPAEPVADASDSTVEPAAEPTAEPLAPVVPAPVTPEEVTPVVPTPVEVKAPAVEPALSDLPFSIALGYQAQNVLDEGTVSGALTLTTDQATSPLSWVDVNFYAEGETYPHHGTNTDVTGRYAISLPAGSYKVSFGEYVSTVSVIPEFFDNVPDRASATAVVISAGGSVVANADLLPDEGKVLVPYVEPAIPTIEGLAAVGQTLTVREGTWGPGDVTFTYVWWRGQVPIPSATGSTYTIVSDDQAKSLSVVVTGWKEGYREVSRLGTVTDVVKTDSTPTPTPTPTPTAAPTTAPTTVPAVPKTPPTFGPAVSLPSSSVGQGGYVVVAGSGYQPFEIYKVWLHSTPVLLGTLTADAQGQIRGSFKIPAGIAVGTHHIVLRDSSGVEVTSTAVSVTAMNTVAVTDTSAVSLASTGAEVSGGWFALALVLLGALALTVSAPATAQTRARGSMEPTIN